MTWEKSIEIVKNLLDVSPQICVAKLEYLTGLAEGIKLAREENNKDKDKKK
jgi:hypothetical protein